MAQRIGDNWKRLKATMSPAGFKHNLEYLAFRAMVALARLLPFHLCTYVFATITAHYSIRTRRHRRALANLQVAFPRSTPAERERIAWEMWQNVGRVLAEAIHIDRFLAEPQRVEVLSLRPFDEYEEEKSLYITVGMHLSNWELGFLHSTLRGFMPVALYRAVANPLVDEYVRKSRLKVISGGLFALRMRPDGRLSTAQETSRQLVNVLREGGPLGMLADHYDPDGVEVPFFGRSVSVSRVPATLAYQFDAKVVLGRGVRVGRQSRFVGETLVLKLPRTGNRRDDIVAATELMFRQFETWIRQHPEMWLWSQAPFVRSDQV